MKIVIGLVGEMGAGKQTFVDLLRSLLPTRTIDHQSTSLRLQKILELCHLEKTRENLQLVPQAIEHYFGRGVIARAMEIDVERSEAEIVIYDSIRWQTDLDVVRKFPLHFVVHIAAPPWQRWRRLKERKEKKGEQYVSFEKFEEFSEAPTEREIPRLAQHASIVLVNNQGVDELRERMRDIIIVPLLKMF